MPRVNVRPLMGAATNMRIKKEKDWLKPWQRKALKNGRMPLPESPGHRPWIPSTQEAGLVLVRQPSKSTLPRTLPEKATGLPKCQWSRVEILLLLDLRTKRVSWTDMLEYFPHRSIDGIKQAWWKYRLSLTPSGRSIRLKPKKRTKKSEKENTAVMDSDTDEALSK